MIVTPWVVSNAGGSGYAWSGLNTYNQHAAKVTIPTSCAITQLRIKAAGYNTGTVAARIALWSVGGSALAQSGTFTMADGNESTQYTYTETLATPEVVGANDYWVGIYRNPGESHIMGTTSGSGNGYRKSNTAGWPSISSMSGYNTDTDDEPTVGAFYITAPSAVTGQTVSRNSDTSHTIEWTRTASADDPYYNQYIERYDNVTGSWYAIKTITTDYTSTGSNSYTDTTTIANRYYRYRIRAWNNAGYSSYAYTDYINTTPAAPTSVVATRIGGTVEVTWNDNATHETNYKVQRNTSTDGVTWAGYSTLTSALAANSESYTDNSPANYNKYKVSATCTPPSLESTQVESNTVQTLSTPDEPTGLSPDALVFDAADLQNFSWNHNPTDGTAQTKYSLQYKVSGGAYPGLPQYEEEASGTENVDIAGSTFTNGNTYLWQVKTWGDYATGSDWSDEAEFICTTTPDATITDPTALSEYGYSELTVEWEYTQAETNNQIQYLCKLYDSDDLLLESKLVSAEVASGSSGSCTFNYTLENETSYKVTLQVKEENGLWSEETEVEFETLFLQPMQPTITLDLQEDDGAINIEITNPDVISEYELTAIQDSYVYNYTSYDDTNYDGEGELNLYYGASDDYQGICLDFNLTSILGKDVLDAQLVLYRKSAFSGDMQSEVHYINDTWDETTATYNNLISKVDAGDYGSHSHAAGDSETWDITTLIQDIAEGTITDYEGLYILTGGTGYPTDEFYDKSIADYEPKLIITITPENAEAVSNTVYRSVDGGNYETILTDVPLNTIVTDYIPTIGGNNKYFVEAVSAVPSINASEVSELDVLLTGNYFINGGDGFSEFVKIIGNVQISEQRERAETLKQFEGRTYPVKYQGSYKRQILNFSCDLPFEFYDTLFDIIEYVGAIFFRDFRGRWFYCSIQSPKVTRIDNNAYQFSCTIERVEHETS